MKERALIAIVMVTALLLPAPAKVFAADVALYYPPEWATKATEARAIAQVLSQSSELAIHPVVAQTYPEIIAAFTKNQPTLVYVGSFLQALLYARELSTPMLQGIDGKEFYTSVLVAPSSVGTNPVAIVKGAGTAV